MALLAKQNWRVLIDETALLHKLYKAKYFPDRDFMDATLGHTPSYTWLGNREARFLLKEGIRWRVGDGKL